MWIYLDFAIYQTFSKDFLCFAVTDFSFRKFYFYQLIVISFITCLNQEGTFFTSTYDCHSSLSNGFYIINFNLCNFSYTLKEKNNLLTSQIFIEKATVASEVEFSWDICFCSKYSVLLYHFPLNYSSSLNLSSYYIWFFALFIRV